MQLSCENLKAAASRRTPKAVYGLSCSDVRSTDRRAQPGGEAQFRPLPRRLHVSAFIARVQKLEITNCDLKFVGWAADCTLRIHRAGRGNALNGPAQPAGDWGEHRNHARLC